VNLKKKLYLYTFFLHALLLMGVIVFVQEKGIVFLFIEFTLLVSVVLFLRLVHRVLAPFDYVDHFRKILGEQEFNTRFSKTGNRDLDDLLGLFNKMLTQLYEERSLLGDRKGMLQQLLDELPISVLVFDYEDRLSQINPAGCHFFQVELKSFLGRPLAHIDHPLIEPLSQIEMGRAKLMSDGSGKSYRCYHGSFRDRGFDRRFLFIQELTTELNSGQKQTYEKLIRMMSHEVNNTMAAARSILKSCLHYADQIEPSEREDYENALKLVIERADKLNHFMQDYAKLVRLPKPCLETCNLHHTFLSVQHLFGPELESRGIQFHIEAATLEGVAIQADQSQLEQVFINIVKNAMEAISEKGEIRVSIQESGSGKYMFLRIEDDGPGLPKEASENLFKPFFTTKPHGQGLGLMLVRDILDAHGFAFRLSNRQPNGTLFEIRLP